MLKLQDCAIKIIEKFYKNKIKKLYYITHSIFVQLLQNIKLELNIKLQLVELKI